MAVVGAAAAVFGAYVAYSAAGDAKDAAQDAAQQEKEMSAQQAANIEAETEESVRRAKDKAAKTEGENRARANASGLELMGSLDLSLDAMTEEHARQIDWMGKAGASKARMALMGGDMRAAGQNARADAFQAQQWGAVSSGVSSVYSGGQTSGWWA
jgi:hypothetical protein